MKHKEREHALLSASKSSMWLACPPSALLNDKVEEKPNAYAEEGTLAHELAEAKLRRVLTCCDSKARDTLDKQIKKIQGDARCDTEMISCIDCYRETVKEMFLEARQRSSDAIILLEEKVDYSAWVPNGFGSCDVIIIADGQMDVIDLKYGKGVPVSAVGNSQMRIYALGAIDAYGIFYDIEKVNMTIIQPRLDSISNDIMTAEDLLQWAENTVKPIAAAAAAGEGDFSPGEKQCRWCKVKATCRARADANMAALEYEFQDPALLSLDEIGPILHIADQLKKWVTDIQDYALDQMKDGKKIPDWKIVEGRSIRKFTDTDAVIDTLIKAGYKKKDLLKPAEMITLGDIEKKLLGKKQFAEILGDLVAKPPGKPTLAPESDPRPAMNSIESDFEDMEDIEL